MADIFLVQDEIVNQIVAMTAGPYGAIERNETKVSARKSPEQIEAYDLILRARDIMQWDWTADTFRAAREALNKAIALDPSNARARRELAWLAVQGWVFQLDETPVPQEEIVAQATKAAQLDPADARARMVAASAYFFAKQLDQFEREADQALALAPYDAEIIATLACMISSAGDHARGVELQKINAERRLGDWLVSHDGVHRGIPERRQRARDRGGETESRPRDVLLVYRDHPDLWPAWPQEGGARGVAHAARRDSRRIRQDLRGLVAFVEHLRARDYPLDGRRLQIGRAGCGGKTSTCRSLYFRLGKLNRAAPDARRPARGHGLEPRVEAQAFRTVDGMIAEQGPLPAAEGVIGDGNRDRHLMPTMPISIWRRSRAPCRRRG
jgi:tetratricopeptide (TPR) repeat protein